MREQFPGESSMADQQSVCGRFDEKLLSLNFKPVPRILVEHPASEVVEVLKRKEGDNHHVITVSGSSAEKCWQRSVNDKELDQILAALKKILAE